MPLYEYECKKCRHVFEALVAGPGSKSKCPECGSVSLEKLFSAFSAQAGKPSFEPSCASGGCSSGSCPSGHCPYN